MELKDKFKNLDPDELDELSEESELKEELGEDSDDDFDGISDKESSPEDEISDKVDESNSDEGSAIETEAEIDDTELMEQEFANLPRDYKVLNQIYNVVSDYTKYDLSYALTNVLQFTNSSFHTASKEAEEVVGTKGRYRSVKGDVQAASYFNFSYDDDADDYDIQQMNQLVVNMLQQYIDDHDVDRMNNDITDEMRKSNLDSIKVVLILMVSCNKYDFFPELVLPKYAQKWVIDTMQFISDSQEDVWNEWINYLNKGKNSFVAEKCVEVGYAFFKVSKAIDTFGRYFTAEEIAEIRDYDGMYEEFLKARDEFNKLSNGVNYKTLYPIFDITDDTFTTRKRKVLTEFANKYSEMAEDKEKAVEALKTIFLEQSND